jgi:hypothetical protein
MSPLRLTIERLGAHDATTHSARVAAAVRKDDETIEQLRAAFSSRLALLAVAERITQRIDTGTFNAADKASSRDLLNVISQTMALPPATSPSVLEVFFAIEFSATLLPEHGWASVARASRALLYAEQHPPSGPPRELSWAELEGALRERSDALVDGNETGLVDDQLAMGELLTAVRGWSGDRSDESLSKPSFILSVHS